jgi:hypothetical protein
MPKRSYFVDLCSSGAGDTGRMYVLTWNEIGLGRIHEKKMRLVETKIVRF